MKSTDRPISVVLKALALAALGAGAGLADSALRPVKTGLAAPTIDPQPPPGPAPGGGIPPTTMGVEPGATPGSTPGARTGPVPHATGTPLAIGPSAAPCDTSLLSIPAITNTPAPGLPAGQINTETAFEYHAFRAAPFIDVRDPTEFAAGHIPKAISMPLTEATSGRIPAAVLALPRDRDIVVYCGGGECEASIDAGIVLQGLSQPFQRVWVYHDGFPGWIGEKHPCEGGPPTPAPAPAPRGAR